MFTTVVRMINIKGSYVGNRQDGVEALDFFARGLIKAPFKKAPLKDLPQIFELMGTLLFCFHPSTLILMLMVVGMQSRARLWAVTSWRFPSERAGSRNGDLPRRIRMKTSGKITESVATIGVHEK